MKMIPGELLFLGTGASAGVPVIGCHCPVCLSDNPRNKRLRTAALMKIHGKNILVDCGPDYRTQALTHHIDTLDGVIFTHSHNDHTAGIDDLKLYCVRSKKPLPCLASEETVRDLETRFQYLFNPKDAYKSYSTDLAMQLLPAREGVVTFLGLNIRYFTFEQMGMGVNGFCFGDLAYVTDIREYDDAIFAHLKGIKILIVSALRMTHSYMHLTVDEAVEFARKVGAEHTWLIHTSHELEYETVNAYLPENVRMAYDGLSLQFHGEVTDGL